MSETLIPEQSSGRSFDDPRDLYADLVKRTLTGYAFGETWQPSEARGTSLRGAVHRQRQRLLRRRGLEAVCKFSFDAEARASGRDWPPDAETMVGPHRLDNVEHCVLDVLRRRVPGDLVETGVWHGGTTVFMRALLAAYGDRDRVVWVADSFRGLLQQVQENFRRYGLLDDQVRFLAGWFEDTLPTAPVRRIAVLRLDGDIYRSTSSALHALYPKLSVGGYVIIDDYHAVRGCKQAVDDYRSQYDITDELVPVDQTCHYWRRTH